LPLKSKDPRSFIIPVAMSALFVDKALFDLGASIKLMPFGYAEENG